MQKNKEIIENKKVCPFPLTLLTFSCKKATPVIDNIKKYHLLPFPEDFY